MKFPRIYTDAEGETHIGFREMAQRETRVGPPPNPLGLRTDVEPVTGIFTFSVSAGTEVPMHTAPQPYICIVLSGEGEVATSDGATLRLRPGELIYCDDISGKGHTTRSITDCSIAFINRTSA
jgi:quercetin dioxygenase-like cupin family protein